tara:strand:- start:5820 stop:6014 length:195 start_codon:yes stop_codon:yes gene_type:complete
MVLPRIKTAPNIIEMQTGMFSLVALFILLYIFPTFTGAVGLTNPTLKLYIVWGVALIAIVNIVS